MRSQIFEKWFNLIQTLKNDSFICHFLFFFSLENKPKIKQEHKHKSSKNTNTNTNADKSSKNTNTNPTRIQTQTHQSIFSKTSNSPICLPPSTQTPSTNKLKWKKPNNKSQIPDTHGQIKQNTLFNLPISPWPKTPSSTSYNHKPSRLDWWGQRRDGVAEESFRGRDGVVGMASFDEWLRRWIMSFWCWGWWCEMVLLVLRRQKWRHWICSKPKSAPNKNIKKERGKKKKTFRSGLVFVYNWFLWKNLCTNFGIFWFFVVLLVGLNIVGLLFLCVHDQDEFGIGIW